MWNPFSNGQSAAEAQANLDRQVKLRTAQLQRKAEKGTATDADWAELRRLTGETPSDFYTAEDNLDAGWNEFEQDAWDNAKSLPGDIANGVKGGAGWLGETVGGIVGNLGGGAVKGLFKGWANPVTITILIVGAVVVVWAFLHGPLKGAKLKAIPIPV